MLKASKESASHNIKIGIAWQMYIRDRQDEQPWPCSWVVAHTSESAGLLRNKVHKTVSGQP